MPKLEWDKTGERFYETGVSKGVLYTMKAGKYGEGVAWNGLSAINESPSGGEATPVYADNIKYLNLMSVEELGATIEAYTYPDEFEECDGSFTLAPGITAGQQSRSKFGLCYRTEIGNDVTDTAGYKLHLLYGCLASPSEKSHSTVNDSPEAVTMSWTITTDPVKVPGAAKPSAGITIDSRNTDAKVLKAIEDALYGTESEAPKFLSPQEIMDLITANSTKPKAK